MRGLFFCFILISSFSLFSQKNNERHLKVHFRVNNSFAELTNLIIREVYESGFKDTVFAEKANHSIDIPVNKHVLLEFICEGHVTKRVAFNTAVPDDLKNIPFFNLEVELIEEDFLMSLENHKEIKTLMDFPVGYINFNSNESSWYNSQENITKTINKLIKKSLK
jgi:hypothetical protein